jgi:hypothetical protein
MNHRQSFPDSADSGGEAVAIGLERSNSLEFGTNLAYANSYPVISGLLRGGEGLLGGLSLRRDEEPAGETRVSI